jgi:hypothetical protein
MIEAFEERAKLCTCPFESHKMQREANNYKTMLEKEEKND